MKRIFTLLILALTLHTGVALAKEKTAKDKSIVVSAKRNTFYFRIKGKMIGGIVEVYDANKTLLGLEELTQREMLIDFTELPTGKYTIKIKRFRSVKIFSYEKPAVG